MLVEQVSQLPPIERYFYWIKERHSIYLKRGLSLPPAEWTEDTILKTFKFTNPFRENDRTTVWFRDNVREPLKDDGSVLWATIIFRWFNLIQTGEILRTSSTSAGPGGLMQYWDGAEAYQQLCHQPQWVTGAYIIKTPDGMTKLDGVIWCIDQVWKERHNLMNAMRDAKLLSNGWRLLLPFQYMGPFMAYEVISDLRWTQYFENAPDIMTWANAGPGAMRGLNRIHGRDLKYRSSRHDWCKEMRELLAVASAHLPADFPRLEMREIEHSLCEFDKYERVRCGEGRPRSIFKPHQERQ